MGKRPLVGVVGLVWAGIALTGCCGWNQHTRNTYNPKSTWQMKETGAPKAPGVEAPGSGDLVPARPPVPSSAGMTGADGTPLPQVSSGSSVAPQAPKLKQEALRHPIESDLSAPRDTGFDIRSRETATSGLAREPNSLRLPPQPVVGTSATRSDSLPPVSSAAPVNTAPPLPTVVNGSSLPGQTPPLPPLVNGSQPPAFPPK